MAAAEETSATVVDMRFVKPLDEVLIAELAASHSLIITVEENVLSGGAGSAVLEFASRSGIQTPIKCLGLPDTFQDQGTRAELLEEAGLSVEAIKQYLIDA